MNKAIKALLLSAFVFPGVGHLYLKKYISAAIIASAAFMALYVLISNAVDRAMDIVDKVQHGEIPLDVAVMTELISKQTTDNDALFVNIATVSFIIFWLVGVIDAYRIGRSLEREHAKGG